MMPSKLKRKVVDEKVKTNGNEKQKEKESTEAESDYESDQVSFVILTCAFIYKKLFVAGKLPHRNSER